MVNANFILDKSMQPEMVKFNNCGKRIGIFVTAYNADSKIKDTLYKIPKEIIQNISVIYVIDDCSSNNNIEEAIGCKDDIGCKLVVLKNRANQMYGRNQKIGYQYAIDSNLDIVVTLYAGGQYAPEFLGDLLTPIVSGKADIVMGSRMLGRTNATLGNTILTRIENALCRMKLSEFNSGYRIYRVDLLKKIPFWENTNNWHFDTEILLQAEILNCKIKEVPIPTHHEDEISYVNAIGYGTNCILTAIRYYLFRKKLFYSRVFDINPEGRRYFGKFDDPYSSHSKIYSKIWKQLQGARVLELGVGDTSLTRKMVENGAIVDAIEIDPRSAELAEIYCQRVYQSNLEDLKNIGLSDEYDIVLAVDVLEHLKEPEHVLYKIKDYVKKDGLLIVCLPNVANLYVRINLLFGRFPYHTKGILDKTHLHFYTLNSAKSMLTKTGWVVFEKDVTSIPAGIVFPFLLRKKLLWLIGLLHAITKVMKCLLAYQWIFYCRNPNKELAVELISYRS